MEEKETTLKVDLLVILGTNEREKKILYLKI